ncbi:RNA polymerase sigma factor [Urbifossiella limnaea]|uniref:ECF RNA polymerase sigma factor SigL n=1 Tax=Urbifossiella limnaea TaxID=2528023 RepID=A0A517XNA3_9BACT|nr:ECF RNA polymerase sigma factor SigL [Urbifossiella limnaea]
MTWDDVHALLTRLRDRDPECWDDLSALVYPFLTACAAQAVGSGWADTSSSDIVQESWMKLRAGFSTFRGADTPADTAACLRAWLRTVVRNVARDRTRRPSAPPTHPLEPHAFGTAAPAASDPTPSTQAARAEWRTRLEGAIAALGPDEQLIIRRSLYEGVSCRQIATELGLADHTVVGGWRKEILATLRRALGDE